MTTRAPSRNRTGERYRKQGCSRLYLDYLDWTAGMLNSYCDPTEESARRCREYVDDGKSRINWLAADGPRSVLLGRYVERKTVPELAKELGVADRTIQNWSERGLLDLYPHLPDGWKNAFVRSDDGEEV